MIVQPINEQQRQQVVHATETCVRRAEQIYRLEFAAIPVVFDLKGRAAGMYRVLRNRRRIRYNPYIFAKYFDDNLSETVPHEVAHYVTDLLYGLRNVRPHGAEWQAVMQALGADPRATGSYDLSGVPVRRQRRFNYRCNCATHSVSASRHNRIHSGKAAYLCKHCGAPIEYTVEREDSEP